MSRGAIITHSVSAATFALNIGLSLVVHNWSGALGWASALMWVGTCTAAELRCAL